MGLSLYFMCTQSKVPLVYSSRILMSTFNITIFTLVFVFAGPGCLMLNEDQVSKAWVLIFPNSTAGYP